MSPFSKIIAGFECGLLPNGHNLLETTKHVPTKNMRDHYKTVHDHGLTTVRDGLIDGGGVYRRMYASKDMNVLPIWDIIHFHKHDATTAAGLARECARYHAQINYDKPFWFVPLNEIETHAWYLGTGIKGAADIWCAVYDAVKSRLGHKAKAISSSVLKSVDGPWDGIDMIANKCEAIGINIYPHTHEETIYDLILATHARYGMPIIITETSFHNGHPEHIGTKRSWAMHVNRHVNRARKDGIDVWAWCWYPIVNCLEWDHPHLAEWDHGLIRQDGSIDPELSEILKELNK